MIPIEASQAVNLALSLLPKQMDTPAARVELYAIGLQESRFATRVQIVAGKPGAKGPARGFWQFELGGGCKGVVNHAASRFWIAGILKRQGYPLTSVGLFEAVEYDDAVAAAAARLLLFTDPKPLPQIGDHQGAWDCYVRNWRPGKPHRKSWDVLYDEAVSFVLGGKP